MVFLSHGPTYIDILARYLHVFAGMAAANDPIRKCKGYRKLLRALTKKRIHLPSVTDLREGTKISAIRVGVGRRPNHVCVVSRASSSSMSKGFHRQKDRIGLVFSRPIGKAAPVYITLT